MKIGINLDGGIIQSVALLDRDGPDVAVVIDYDIDDLDPNDLTEVPQPDGGEWSSAFVHEVMFDQWPEATARWYREVL
jgi:hypothetical protein